MSKEVVIGGNDVLIRHMTEDDVNAAKQLIQVTFRGRGTIFPELLAIDRKGIFVAIDSTNNQVIGVCSGVFIRPDVAFIGHYVVSEEHRGRGIGQWLFDCVMSYIGDRNCCLFCWPEKYTLYRGLGFVLEAKQKVIAYSGVYKPKEMDASVDDNNNGYDIKPILSDEVIDSVIEYDQHIHGYKRDQLLRLWFKERDCQSLVALAIVDGQSTVVGYGSLTRDTKTMFRPRPIYADNATIAKQLIVSLLSLAAKVATNPEIKLPVISTNDAAIRIATELGFKVVTELSQLFRHSIVDYDYDRVYAIMGLGFGI